MSGLNADQGGLADSKQDGNKSNDSNSNFSNVLSSNKQRALSVALAGYAVLFLLLRAVPWSPEKYVLSFDISWDLALHYLTCHGAKFGQDLIFTFGPLGFAYARTYFPDDYKVTLAIWSLLSVVYGVSLSKFARLSFSRVWTAFLWLTAAIVLVGSYSDSFFFASVLLILCDYFLLGADEPRPSKTALALAVTLGVVASVKFTFALSAALALSFIAADEMLRRRRLPILAAIAGLVFLGVWVASGQPLPLLFDFVRYSLEVTRGYSDTLALGTSYAQICSTAVLGSLTFFALSYCAYRQLKIWSFGFLIAMAGVLFAIFKAAYVRHDLGHGTIAAIGFSFFSILLMACVHQLRGTSKTQKIFSQILAAAFIFVVLPWNFAAPVYAFPLLCISSVIKATKNLTMISEDLTTEKTNRAEFEKMLVGIRSAAPLPPVGESIDAYPIDAKLLIANNFAYAPRPLLQSYQAYTNALLVADSQHLQNARAPQRLLLSGVPWEDNWLPALNDGPSFPLVLSLYEEDKITSGQILMKRRSSPLFTSLTPLKEFTALIGEDIDLSEYKGKLLWAQITPELSLFGELARFAYHVLPLSISVDAGESGVKTFVAPRVSLSEGFLISPFWDDTDELARVLKFDKPAAWQGLSVSKIHFNDRNPQWWGAFRPAMKVKLFALNVSENQTLLP